MVLGFLGSTVSLHSLRTYSVGVRWGLGGLWVLVGFAVRVWSLIWPKDS